MHSRSSVAGVFFDLDGTLADTAPDLGGSLNQLLEEFGRSALPMSSIRPHVSSGTRGMLKVGFGLNPDDSNYSTYAERFIELYSARLCVDTKLFDGMPELLDHLDQNCIVWGIVTNKPARLTLPLAAYLKVGHRAAVIVSGDSTARPKPAPDSLLLACADTRVTPAEAIYVGDDLRDILASRAAGMTAIAAGWGYLGSGPAVSEWGADAVIGSPMQLLDWL
jgi:phosphoglycolate phosphatase